jgi:hypothetical protein
VALVPLIRKYSQITRGGTVSNSGQEERISHSRHYLRPRHQEVADDYEQPTVEDMANALKRFPRYKIDNQPQTGTAAPNSPKRSRATVGDTGLNHSRTAKYQSKPPDGGGTHL